MARPRISIVIATRRRPAGLVAAARSAFHQAGVDAPTLEMVIVDNDEGGSARILADALAQEAPFAVAYVHEPAPGVANARNAAIARASGAFIAFLDDDQEASPGWLYALSLVQARYDADAVFGPVKARTPKSLGVHRPYLERFFSRAGPSADGLITHHHGCGGALIRRAALPNPDAPFSTGRGHGEDDLLFAKMRAAGARLAWAPRAWLWQDPDPSRLTLGYAIRRAFAYGQAPSSARAIACPPDRLGLAESMAEGMVQATIFGLIATVKWFVGAKDWTEALDRAARGLGKTLWWGPFRLRLERGPA